MATPAASNARFENIGAVSNKGFELLLNTQLHDSQRFRWEATPGRHDITVRATDGNGDLQVEERTGVVPDGATGWMSLAVTVE